MKIIDFSEFLTDAHSYGGTDNKSSIYMDGKYYMVKQPTIIEKNERNASLQTSMSNNVISEYIGSHIMQALGLPAQNTLLGCWGREDNIVVACEDFRKDGFELHEFSWYMQGVIQKQEIGRIATYEQLYRTFDENPFLQPIRQEAIDRYWDIVMVDAFIGNFDRHKDNFGFLTNKDTHEIKCAPVYDCGSCLYPSLAEDKLERILSDMDEIEKRIYTFPKLALNKNNNKNNEDKFGYYDLFSSNFDENCSRALFLWHDRFDAAKERIADIIENTPFISDLRKTFYIEMLMYRNELIIEKAFDELEKNKDVEANKDYYMERRVEAEEQAEKMKAEGKSNRTEWFAE